jgi:hypothetical protein
MGKLIILSFCFLLFSCRPEAKNQYSDVKKTPYNLSVSTPAGEKTLSLSEMATTPKVAENGSYYGEISENTGRPKTVHVRGYYRKDGTYVRSYYRSPPK